MPISRALDMLLRPRTLAVLLLLLVASPLVAQSGQYTVPGAAGRHPVDAREALRNEVDEARWRLGPFRIEPWLGLRDAAWVKNRGEEGDLTVSVGAGLRAYLPVGSRVVLTAHALPEYIWWRDRGSDSRVGGRAGLGLFAYTNRFGLEVRARSTDLDAYVTPEIQRRTPTESRSLSARLEVPLGRRLALFATGSRSKTTVDDPNAALALLSDLDRTATSVEAGIRFLFGRDLALDLGIGESETIFEGEARDRSNDGDYTSVGVSWNRPKLGVSVSTRRYELVGLPGSEFGQFDGTTWSGQISWSPRRSFGLALYGQRELLYSVTTDADYFFDRRVGVRFGLPLGSRMQASVFVEEGEHEYADGGLDDVSSWGGGLGFPIYRKLRLDVVARTTEVDGATGAREVRDLGVRVSLGGGGPAWD